MYSGEKTANHSESVGMSSSRIVRAGARGQSSRNNTAVNPAMLSPSKSPAPDFSPSLLRIAQISQLMVAQTNIDFIQVFKHYSAHLPTLPSSCPCALLLFSPAAGRDAAMAATPPDFEDDDPVAKEVTSDLVAAERAVTGEGRQKTATSRKRSRRPRLRRTSLENNPAGR